MRGAVYPTLYSGHHEYEGVCGRNARAPATGVLLKVALFGRVVRLIQQRKAHVGEVDDLDIEAEFRSDLVGEPVGDDGSDSAGPGANDDYVQLHDVALLVAYGLVEPGC